MANFITAETYEDRLRYAVSAAWDIFSRKVAANVLPINKEASAQLQYAYILLQLLPLASHSNNEVANIELETGVQLKSGLNNIDILLKSKSDLGKYAIAIELKCYRNVSSSGGKRGAHDIFMKDIYDDLNILENYVSNGVANKGVLLVMNDLERFVNPKIKRGKCWAYDTSDGHKISGASLSVPIGGKNISIELIKSYQFNWEKFGDFWFMELEGF